MADHGNLFYSGNWKKRVRSISIVITQKRPFFKIYLLHVLSNYPKTFRIFSRHENKDIIIGQNFDLGF